MILPPKVVKIWSKSGPRYGFEDLGQKDSQNLGQSSSNTDSLKCKEFGPKIYQGLKELSNFAFIAWRTH